MRLPVLLALALSATAVAEGRELLIHAHFTPGGLSVGHIDYSAPHTRRDNPDPWDLKLYSDGRGQRVWYMSVVHGGTLDSKHVGNTIVLSPSAVRALIAVVRQSDFFTLPSVVPADPVLHHARVLDLSIEVAGKKHDVRFFCEGADKHVTNRLSRIWSALLRHVPSPNENVELACFE